MRNQAFLIAGLSLLFTTGAAVAESAPPPDAPIEIEGWEKASDKAQSALKAYYEARRNQPKKTDAVAIPSATRVKQAPVNPPLPKAPGAEEPEQVSTVKELQEQEPGRLPIAPKTEMTLEEEVGIEEEPEVPVEKKEVDSTTYRDLNATRGYFINRGGGLQYFERGSDTFGEGYLNAKRIKRSQYEKISPYRGPVRLQERRTTYRDHLTREGRLYRTRSNYR